MLKSHATWVHRRLALVLCARRHSRAGKPLLIVQGPTNLRSPQTAEVRLIEGIMAEHVDSLGMWDDSPVVGYDKALGPNGDQLVENNELTGLKILGQSQSICVA